MDVSAIPSELNLEKLFPFELDNFQIRAITALDAQKSVVVCVPTGSGKTLVGEYAIHRALAREKRVFYTTPLKALSNQKLRDFREYFGADKIGLLTGDVTINRDAPILVMTTEVFRNMLYGTPLGRVQGLPSSLEGVEAVVLDECHYMNDPSRGTVWEESIIYCPEDIQLLALSATIANAGQLTDWINQIHGSTELIKSEFRPVPLQFNFSTPKGLFPLLNQDQSKINPRLKQKKRSRGNRQRVKPEDCPSPEEVIRQLQRRDMLPAIYFIFSRRGCDQATEKLDSLSLVNEQEAAEIKKRVNTFLTQHPDGARAGQIEPLTRGFAAHHAGILPAWKGLVEELFGLGLVKVVFATETLAAGINMPARTTVISAISKRTDRGYRLLRASEFLQMAGRAGRRGMDERGYVVCTQTRFEGAKEAAYLATKEADPLVSQFTPTYGMVLNLLQIHTLDEVKRLLERSFAQYLATLRVAPEQKAIADLTTELTKLDVELAPIPVEQFAQFEKLQARLKQERRIAKYLKKQAEKDRIPAIAAALSQVSPGRILYLKGKHISVSSPLPAVLFTKASGQGQSEILICLGSDNRWYVATHVDVAEVEEESLPSSVLDPLVPPKDLVIKPGKRRQGDDATAAVADGIPKDAAALPEAPEVAAQQQKLEALQTQLDESPLHKWGKPGSLIKRHKRRLALREELSERQANSRQHQSQHWQEFLNLIEVLQTFGALEKHTPTPFGKTTAAIRSDNELWLALALTSEELDSLDPQHLAAAVCALVSEPPRSDSWTSYHPPEPAMQALARLRKIRRKLFQAQHRHNVGMSIWMESDLIGLVEQWVLGTEWSELCENTSLDEGDIVRMLRRTIDILSQIPHIPNLTDALQRNAQRAVRLMERFPIED